MEKVMKLLDEEPEEAKKVVRQLMLDAEEKKKLQMRTNRVPLSRQRGVDKIPTFQGKEFLPFQKKLLGFAQDEPGCAKLLRLVSKQYRKREINAIVMDEIAEEPEMSEVPVKMLSSELHSLL